MTSTDPVKNTSGAGYAFEDRVGAWLAAALLSGQAPLDAELGAPVRIDFQTSADGSRLDDVLVTFRPGEEDVRWAASIKSNAQFSAKSAPAGFVELAWDEIGRFDLIGLVTAPIGTATRADLQELIRLAREQEPQDLDRRVQVAGYVSADRGKLWESFRHGDPTRSPGELLRRLRPLEADFEFSPSRSEAQALEWCRVALRDGARAGHLWARLLEIVSTSRTASGTLTWPRLRERLAGFELAGLPRFEPDRRQLQELTQRNMDGVVEVLTGNVVIPRDSQRSAIDQAAGEARFMALVGPSGVGKTALARAWAGDRDALWLTAEDALALLEPRALDHALPDVLAAWPRTGWLVIDGLDRAFAAPVFAAVATILRAMRDGPLGVLVTVQQQEWPRVADALAQANASVEWRQVPVGAFDDEEMAAVYVAYPRLRDVVVRGRLGRVLHNAKVLDVVTRRLAAGDSLEIVDDEAHVATWFVERLVGGTGDERLARTRAVMSLAELQADRLESATALLDVPDGLDPLQRDGICVVENGRVAFTHDLYGDWTRAEVLRSRSAELGSYLERRLSSPLWHRAVRLYATGLLDNPRRWRDELQRIAPGPPGLVHDLFLEAALFAGDPAAALERLWPDLEADGGRLLGRLLQRFGHVATVANPALVAQITAIDPALATQAATLQRIPYWPLWVPLLTVLHRHAETAVAPVGSLVAGLANQWLRFTEPGWPLRQEAADLALRHAWHVIDLTRQRVWGLGEMQKDAWRALLAAVPERPEDVRRLVLLLCGLTDESEGVVDEDRDNSGIEVEGSGPPRGPDRSFRDVCLDTDALHPLIVHEPALGADALVTLLTPRTLRIDPFTGPPSDLMDRLGMDRPLEWLHPLYVRGPFLFFLRNAPDEALGATVRVVEMATERWRLEHVHDPSEDVDAPFSHRSPESIELVDSEEILTRFGDAGVMSWYRGEGNSPSTVASMLMAVEKWLYDERDAGRDITSACERLLHESRSVAMAGVLGAVGCRHPDLLAGPLLPLLSSPEVLLWDQQASMLSPASLLFGLDQEPEVFQRLAREWHALEHRKVTLEERAIGVMLGRHRDRFAAWRERWLARVDEHGEPAALRFLAARLGPDNWHERADGGFEYRAPPELQAESDATQAELADRRFWLTAPMQWRQVLDGELRLSAEQLEEAWHHVDVMLEREPPPDVTADGVIGRDDAACGFAAVLVIQHREWLREHRDRERWCLDTLLAAVEAPRERHMMDSPEGGVAWGWDAFCADAVPRLWGECPGDVRLRRAIARLTQNLHLATIGRLFAACASVREKLGDDFGRLRHLAVAVAAERPYARDEQAATRACRELQRHVDAFVESSMTAQMPPWARLAVPSTEGGKREVRGISESYLHTAHAWIPPFGEARDEVERDEWLAFYAEAVDSLVRRLTRDRDDRDNEVRGTPYRHEYGLMYALPERILQLPTDKARSLWEPVLALGSYAYYWVRSFLDTFFSAGLREPRPPSFTGRWRDMVAFAETAERWRDERDLHAEDLRSRLLGLGDAAASRWAAVHAPLVAEMTPFYRRWAEQDLKRTWPAAHFARFLSTEAAAPLLEDGLLWLRDADVGRTQHDERLDMQLESMLSAVIPRRPELARSQTPAGEALRALLRGLLDRQSATAQELMARLQD